MWRILAADYSTYLISMQSHGWCPGKCNVHSVVQVSIAQTQLLCLRLWNFLVLHETCRLKYSTSNCWFVLSILRHVMMCMSRWLYTKDPWSKVNGSNLSIVVHCNARANWVPLNWTTLQNTSACIIHCMQHVFLCITTVHSTSVFWPYSHDFSKYPLSCLKKKKKLNLLLIHFFLSVTAHSIVKKGRLEPAVTMEIHF